MHIENRETENEITKATVKSDKEERNQKMSR